MSNQKHELAKTKLVLQVPGMDSVRIRRDVVYRVGKAGELTMDVYYPSEHRAPLPAVLFVAGYPDVGVPLILGCRFKEMDVWTSWAQVVAASGMAAIMYTNESPATDFPALIDYVRDNAVSLEIDATRIGLLASSGNVPNALSMLMKNSKTSVKCAVLNYGFMLDLDGSTGVADASATFRFVNPCAGKAIDDLNADIPLFITRAGHDQFAGLNESIDRFVLHASMRNLPVTFINHPAAPHAFDMLDEGSTTHHIVRQMLAFLRFHLLRSSEAEPTPCPPAATS